MLIFPLIFKRRKRRVIVPGRPLVMVGVNYQDASSMLLITFDREIDISQYDGTQIQVLDGNIAQTRFDGVTAAWLEDQVTVRIELNYLESYSEPQTVLIATGATGIVALDDGGTWAGVVDYPIG